MRHTFGSGRRGAIPVRRIAAIAFLAGAVVPVTGSPGGAAGAIAAGGSGNLGSFSAPFQPSGPTCVLDPQTNLQVCKPAAASMVALADGRILYWNGIEGEENVSLNVVAELGDVAGNDQTKVVDFRKGQAAATFVNTGDGGAAPEPNSYLIPGVTNGGPDPNAYNDAALFCSDQVQLADGRILDAGGTNYYSEPQIPGTRYGVAELQGVKAGRIFDPATNTWSRTGSMSYGRWYPGLVTLPDGNVFVASGVSKLIKPVYLDNINDTGRNVTETETYSATTGTWSYNGTIANRSLPLFPRLHLLPDGNIIYDGMGQTFNPVGQAYDEALWNLESVYSPLNHTWKVVGLPGLGTTLPGFRGDGFSIMLPLTAPYTSASFLDAGGVIGTSPGTYLATNDSQIHTIDTSRGDALKVTPTGSLTQPRWYSTGVLLPDGSVMAFSGANVDEVLLPGTERAITQAERFDPVTKTWQAMASASRQRTYHNTAVLLPSGQVLVGGHAPIATGYAYDQTLPGGFAPAQRDPSFEIYSPPYIGNAARPAITKAPSSVNYGDTFTVQVGSAQDAQNIAALGSMVLTRYSAITHLVDGDQRQVVLAVTGVSGNTLTVAEPPDAKIAPPGPYMLFANKKSSGALLPSVAATVFVGHKAPGWVTAATSPAPPPPPSQKAQPVPGPVIPPFPPLPAGAAPRTAASSATAATAPRRARSLADVIASVVMY